ncbi:fungal hydrophobin-domain-containing protein [Infundibulicybe gibba]|nr:fungal hydrophobin-domain-containing protein [Infundibulicybe gibba]
MVTCSFVILALPFFAAAIPWGNPPTVTVTKTISPSPTTISQCNTGPVQCCNSVQKADSPQVTSALAGLGLLGGLLGPLGGVLGLLSGLGIDANTLAGLTCSPLNIVGISNTGCASQPVCCSNNNFNGVVALGCTPINIGL